MGKGGDTCKEGINFVEVKRGKKLFLGGLKVATRIGLKSDQLCSKGRNVLNEKKGGKGINREREMQKRGTKSVGISKVQRMSSGIQKRNKN